MKIFILIVCLLLGVNTLASKSDVYYRTEKVDGLEIFYREAGPVDKPTIVLLHGFPTSSHMYRNLIPAISEKFHVIAPDYPGFGQSSKPSPKKFKYTFDNIAGIVDKFLEQRNIGRYSLYVMDYGAPVGYRIAVKHPERIQSLIVQNGNAYEEGLREFWKPLRAYWANRTKKTAEPLKGSFSIDSLKWQYTHGTKDASRISPDNWISDYSHLSSPGNVDVQMELFYDYGSNPKLYPSWQEYFRKYQPPTLIVWGKNDVIFPEEGAHPYKRDLKNIDFNILDTGHFALEEEGDFIAEKILSFTAKHVR